MQLKITFKFEKNQDWKFDKHILQGIFYNAIRTFTQEIHGNDIGLYTSSNIYPFDKQSNFEAGKKYNITFRTIRKDILLAVSGFFLVNKEINFGDDNKIFIEKVDLVNNENFYPGKIIKSITPIVLSLDKELAQKYGIEFNLKDKRPLYWNKNMGFKVFVEQLNKNILKKYVYILEKIISGEWNKNNLEDNIVYYFRKIEDWERKLLKKYENTEEFGQFVEGADLFKGYKFRHGALLNYKKGKIAGSYRDFIIGEDTEDLDKTKILKVVSLMGIGERATAGFGFIK